MAVRLVFNIVVDPPMSVNWARVHRRSAHHQTLAPDGPGRKTSYDSPSSARGNYNIPCRRSAQGVRRRDPRHGLHSSHVLDIERRERSPEGLGAGSVAERRMKATDHVSHEVRWEGKSLCWSRFIGRKTGCRLRGRRPVGDRARPEVTGRPAKSSRGRDAGQWLADQSLADNRASVGR
jgi:hypothetical protein